jgi:CRP-like cAMP-binding protein
MTMHTIDRRPSVSRWSLNAGETLFEAGLSGAVWRLERGALRLMQPDTRILSVVRVALPGDLVGVEIFCDQPYAFSAVALTDCVLVPVQAQTAEQRLASLNAGFLQQQRRLVDMLMLRRGQVAQRVRYLLELLGFDQPESELPAVRKLPYLKDMATLVDSAPESVCRALGALKHPALREQTLTLEATGRKRREKSLRPLDMVAA